MANLNYFLKANKPGKFSPVYLRFYHGKVFDLKTQSGQHVDPGHWNSKKHCVGNYVDATYKPEVNLNLRKLKDFVMDTFAAKSNNIPTKEWLTDVIDLFYNGPKEPKRVTMFNFIRAFIDEAPRRINPKTEQPVCYKQLREYERTFFYLQEFAKLQKREPDFEDITLDFYHDFVKYLQSEKTITRKNGKEVKEPGLAKNTIGKKIQTLKIFLNAATEDGLNQNKQYKSQRFKAVKEDTDSIYLNTDELNSMANLDLSDNKRLETVRDLFLIGCWTGLRFSDWDKVSENNIQNGKLVIKQSKTGNPVVIPLHPVTRVILNKYKYQLPGIISNQKFNLYLKEVAKMAGISGKEQKTITKGGITRTISFEKWEMVGTHTARRSFATNLFFRGVPSISIMAVTGHKTESSFLKYIKVTPDQHAKILDNVWRNDSVTFTMRIA